MMFTRILILTLLPAVLLIAAPGPAVPNKEVFDLKVTRVRTLRDQPGDLHIDAQGIRFRSVDGKTNVAIALKDLRRIPVSSGPLRRKKNGSL